MILDITKELFLVLFVLGLFLFLLLKRYKKNRVRIWVWISLLIYTICLLKITLFPIYIFDKTTLEAMRNGIEEYIVFYQYVPFVSIRNYFHMGAIIQLIGNLLLLIPAAIYMQIWTHAKISVKKQVLFSLLISIVIELLQLMINSITGFPGRVADIDDVILNTVGVLLFSVFLYLIENNCSKQIREICNRLFYE